ncbi:MAG: ATP-binding protein [Candidatus Tectomicrobia bacterium]|nr:ATP-binding protein [Candidatus Tectomicrobia bacterium]
MKLNCTPVPNNEAGRLEALKHYDLLDTECEEEFDRITRLACQIFAAPTCLVSLLDTDRQWFKSRQGLDATETPRDIAFCSYAIMQDDIFVVPNAIEDSRFRNNPLVLQEPKIRFYAGAPLKTSAGFNLGTLCVIDYEPRQFTKEQKNLLGELARIVIDEFELRIANKTLQQEIASKQEILRDFEAVFSNIDCGILFMDSDFRARLINDTYCRLWSVDKAFADGHPTFDERVAYLRSKGTYDFTENEWAEFAGKRHAALVNADGVPEISRRTDGSMIEHKCIPLPDGGRMLTYLDVTVRERNLRLKNEFVSIVSHELRTPLTSLVAALELVFQGMAGALPEKGQTLMTIAHRNARRLATLVDDILDIQKIEVGGMEYHWEPVDIVALTQGALQEIEPLAEDKCVHLQLEEEMDAAWVYADALRLMQVLINLLSNAIKFSQEKGKVTIRLMRRGERILLCVQDDGPGIAPEMHQKIFEKFTQIDSSDTRGKKGTGLGLSIAKAIIEDHGGTVSVDSSLGTGATFIVNVAELTDLGKFDQDLYPASNVACSA